MAELPTSFKAAIVSNHGKDPQFDVKDLPLPELGPSDVLVKLSATGVCGTDFALASGELGPTRSILGHEGVGRIVRVGVALANANVKIDQRDGGETRCVKHVFSGLAVDGTFAQYTVVPYKYILNLPEGIPDEQIAPILCGGVTAYKALKICGATPSSWIAISGAGGGVGALGTQYAKAMGYRVIALDAGEAKQEFCLKNGAEHYINVIAESDLTGKVKSLSNGKGAAAVLVTAGVGAAYQSAIDILASFGTLVCIGIPPPHQTLTIHPLTLIDRGIRLIGSLVGTRGDILEAIEFVRRGAVTPVVEKAKLNDLQEIAKKVTSGEALGKYVIDLEDTGLNEGRT